MWRVAIIGAGRMGFEHARAWAECGQARVSYVASRRTAQWIETVGAEYLTSIEEGIVKTDVDIVDICLPTPLHLYTTELALQSHKHVLLEKPLALTEDDADRIVMAAETSDCALMVAHCVRFFPGYQAVRHIVEAGDLGSPVGVSTYRAGWGNNELEWMRDLSASGGVAVDLLLHDYDQMNIYLERPKTVYATRLADGSVRTVVDYADGRVGSAEGSSSTPRHYPFSYSIRVTCEKGIVEHFAGFGASKPTVRMWSLDGAYREVGVSGEDPYTEQARYFLHCLDSGVPVEEGTPHQGLDAVAVAAAALRSTSTHSPEPVRRRVSDPSAR